jgi:hypothetical protein
MYKHSEITLANLMKSFLRVLLKIRYKPGLKVIKTHHEFLRWVPSMGDGLSLIPML